MARSAAEFRRLKGIGPAAEARLHEAGVGTWAELAQVLAVLVRSAGRYGDLAALTDEVAAQAAGEPDDSDDATAVAGTAPEPERGPGLKPVAAEPVAAIPVAAVTIDAGLAIGGAARQIEVRLDQVPDRFGPQVRAELVGRPLGAGSTGRQQPRWLPLGVQRIPDRGGDGGTTTLTFPAVTLPAGIHRLAVRLRAGATTS
jgi:hypothetical protein